jgi:hypothetical protein
MWKELRPKLDEVLESDPSKRPRSYREALGIAAAKVESCGPLLGNHSIETLAASRLAKLEIKAFIDVCPPFRSACYGLVMAWFNGALKTPQQGEPKSPGRNDLLMATYLPYCERVVTDDWAQGKAAAAHIASTVLSYEEFSNGFAVGAKASSKTG